MSKKSKRKNIKNNTSAYFDLAHIEPLTENQEKAFDSKKNLVLCGSAGTGKSFISCYLAFDRLIKRKVDSVVIIRSAVPTRDMGFLPGNDKEKSRIYEEPYVAISSEILKRGDAYSILKEKNMLHFMTTSYMRGITLKDCDIIVDECQNMTLHELDSIITRLGENCRIMFCGDFKQTDLKNNGLQDFMKVLKKMKSQFDVVEFTTDDIVRSEFVKDYLVTKEAVLL